MSNFNSVKAGSDLESFVNNTEIIFNAQLEKINFMKSRLLKFRGLIREENEVSQKILKLNDLMGSIYENSFHTQSEMSKNEFIQNFEEECN